MHSLSLSGTAISVSLRRTTAILSLSLSLSLQVLILISLSFFKIYDFCFFYDFVLLFHFCYSIQCLLLHNPIRSLLLVSWIFAMNESYWWKVSPFRFKSYLCFFFFTTLWIINVKYQNWSCMIWCPCTESDTNTDTSVHIDNDLQKDLMWTQYWHQHDTDTRDYIQFCHF